MKSKFVYVIYIKTAPEKLWHVLTTPEFIKRWWGGGITITSDWNVGSTWVMSYADGRVADAGEIVEFNPPK
ncbi:MAG TPA: SRPBCC domain-containing protein, partial [Bacteroidota bacterium]|nr:SRPBCC domain-containing protein [Bacteroidota bacterium]